MLTEKVCSAENNCQELHPSKIYIYGAHAVYEQNICLKWEKFNSSIKPGKCTVLSNSSSVILCAMWVQGQWVGVLVGTYICITSPSYKCCNPYIRHVGGKGETYDPATFCFSDLQWHLASSWLNWQMLYATKLPCLIPSLVSKPLSRLLTGSFHLQVRSQASRVLPSWKIPCGNPWQSYSARRS